MFRAQIALPHLSTIRGLGLELCGVPWGAPWEAPWEARGVGNPGSGLFRRMRKRTKRYIIPGGQFGTTPLADSADVEGIGGPCLTILFKRSKEINDFG